MFSHFHETVIYTGQSTLREFYIVSLNYKTFYYTHKFIFRNTDITFLANAEG